MKKVYSKIIGILAVLVIPFFIAFPVATVNVASAQEVNILCQIFPFVQGIKFTAPLCGGGAQGGAVDAVTTATSLVQFGVSLIFVGIIAVAIYIIIKSALKYIQSEGDEAKVEEATKAIKNVFIGIGALLVGIIGLVIIIAVFQASGSSPLPDGTTDNPLDNLITE